MVSLVILGKLEKICSKVGPTNLTAPKTASPIPTLIRQYWIGVVAVSSLKKCVRSFVTRGSCEKQVAPGISESTY